MEITVLYCSKCGWHSKPNEYTRNRCPFCRQSIENWGIRKTFGDVPLSYVCGTEDEVGRFIKENLK